MLSSLEPHLPMQKGHEFVASLGQFSYGWKISASILQLKNYVPIFHEPPEVTQ